MYILITHNLRLFVLLANSIKIHWILMKHQNSLDFNETLRTPTTDEPWRQTDYRQVSQLIALG